MLTTFVKGFNVELCISHVGSMVATKRQTQRHGDIRSIIYRVASPPAGRCGMSPAGCGIKYGGSLAARYVNAGWALLP